MKINWRYGFGVLTRSCLGLGQLRMVYYDSWEPGLQELNVYLVLFSGVQIRASHSILSTKNNWNQTHLQNIPTQNANVAVDIDINYLCI